MQNRQTLAEQQLTAIGVIAPNTSIQKRPSRSPWHKRRTGIQKGLRPQPSPERRLLNFTAMNGQHPVNTTPASLARQPC